MVIVCVHYNVQYYCTLAIFHFPSINSNNTPEVNDNSTSLFPTLSVENLTLLRKYAEAMPKARMKDIKILSKHFDVPMRTLLKLFAYKKGEPVQLISNYGCVCLHIYMYICGSLIFFHAYSTSKPFLSTLASNTCPMWFKSVKL